MSFSRCVFDRTNSISPYCLVFPSIHCFVLSGRPGNCRPFANRVSNCKSQDASISEAAATCAVNQTRAPSPPSLVCYMYGIMFRGRFVLCSVFLLDRGVSVFTNIFLCRRCQASRLIEAARLESNADAGLDQKHGSVSRRIRGDAHQKRVCCARCGSLLTASVVCSAQSMARNCCHWSCAIWRKWAFHGVSALARFCLVTKSRVPVPQASART